MMLVGFAPPAQQDYTAAPDAAWQSQAASKSREAKVVP
jgi:hypothetical protein